MAGSQSPRKCRPNPTGRASNGNNRFSHDLSLSRLIPSIQGRKFLLGGDPVSHLEKYGRLDRNKSRLGKLSERSAGPKVPGVGEICLDAALGRRAGLSERAAADREGLRGGRLCSGRLGGVGTG